MGRGAGRDVKMALGMGALGVAVAAFDHFMEQRRTAGTGPGAVPGGPPAGPGRGAPAPPPPPPGPAPAVPGSDAVLLVRAMIAAAHADGELDPVERNAIVERLGKAGLSDEERRFLGAEMEAPLPLDALLAEVSSAQLAEQVYTVSLLAVRVDSEEERRYLAELAAGLALPAESVARLHAVFGL